MSLTQALVEKTVRDARAEAIAQERVDAVALKLVLIEEDDSLSEPYEDDDSEQVVQALYQGVYAQRRKENHTQVVVHFMASSQKIRVECSRVVRKIGIYNDRLVVQHSDRIVVYELQEPADKPARYEAQAMIEERLDCNIIMVVCDHIMLVKQKTLELWNMSSGSKEREWTLGGVIRYVKPMGGTPGQEDFIVGLAAGHVLRILIDRTEPVQLIKHSVGIRCVDLNTRRNKFAFVDKKQRLYVYTTDAKTLLYEDTKTNCVAWNTWEKEGDTFCYSGDGALAVKDLAANTPKHSQPQQGFAVSFIGPQVFCLDTNRRPWPVAVEVPLQPGVELESEREQDQEPEPEPDAA